MNTSSQLQNSDVEKRNETMLPQVGNNRGTEIEKASKVTDLSGDSLKQIQQAKGDPKSALLLVLEELRENKSQMITLSKIESTTASLVEQMKANINSTKDLEERIDGNATKIQVCSENLKAVKDDLSHQGGRQEELDSTLRKLEESIEPMEARITKQEQQLGGLHTLK